MEELISVITHKSRQVVDARELHMRLEVGKDFSNWIKDRIDKYGFEAGQDFFCLRADQAVEAVDDEEVFAKSGENPTDKENHGEESLIVAKSGDYQTEKSGRGGKREGAGNPNFVLIDYLLSVNMAKELALVENNEIGRKIRRYLIELEGNWSDPEKVVQRALQTGEVVKKDDVREAIEETFNGFKSLAMSMVASPFPGIYGIPKKIRRYSTTKGGRVYILAMDGKKQDRNIVSYDANGVKNGQGICKENFEGNLMCTYFSDWVDMHKKDIGDTYESVRGLEIDDYFNWKISIMENICLQKALPPPEGDTKEIEEDTQGMKKDTVIGTMRRIEDIYEDDDDDESVYFGDGEDVGENEEKSA